MKDKLVVITGGNSGIGKALAEVFSEAGNQVVIIDKKSGEPAAAGFEYIFDLTEKKSITRCAENIVQEHGVPDVVIFNAGRGIHQKLSEGDPETWENIFSVNVFATLHLVRGLVPRMLNNGRGDIVFISSVAAEKPYPCGGIYCASKAALNTIAETLRLEVQPALRVLTVMPGVVDTAFFENIIDGSQNVQNIGWGAVRPREVAGAVFFALSHRTDISINQIIIRPTAQPM